MKFYISGPITGAEGYETKFEAAEEKLTAEGHTVLNPAKLNKIMPRDTEHNEYMIMSFAMIDICDAVYFMPGWQQSRGSNQEYGYAVAKNKARYFQL